MGSIGIIGSSTNGGAIQIIDALLENGEDHNIRLYDDDPEKINAVICGFRVTGNIDRLVEDHRSGMLKHAIVGIGSVRARKAVYEQLKAYDIPTTNVISPNALVSQYCEMGTGNVVLANAYLGPGVVIGDNNYITTSTTINHDTHIGSGNYFSTSVAVAGRVRISDSCRFDTGAIVLADADVKSLSHIKPGEIAGPARGL